MDTQRDRGPSAAEEELSRLVAERVQFLRSRGDERDAGEIARVARIEYRQWISEHQQRVRA
jgi:hypothetical protein